MNKFEIYKGEDRGEQCWRWRLFDDNGNNTARSEEPFLKQNIKSSINKIKENVSEQTPIFQDESCSDTDQGWRFEYFQSETDQKWYWRLKAANHELMAIGGEGFKSECDVKSEIGKVAGVITMGPGVAFANKEDEPAREAEQQNDTADNPQIPSGS